MAARVVVTDRASVHDLSIGLAVAEPAATNPACRDPSRAHRTGRHRTVDQQTPQPDGPAPFPADCSPALPDCCVVDRNKRFDPVVLGSARAAVVVVIVVVVIAFGWAVVTVLDWQEEAALQVMRKCPT